MTLLKTTSFAVTFATVLATTGASSAAANSRDPESFAPQIRNEAADFELCSTGLVRRFLMRALAAGLYLETCDRTADALADIPKSLEISYFWSIAAKDFAQAGDEVLRRGFSPDELVPVRDRIDRLHAAYRDVRPGDRYRLTYIPGRGTELALNGSRLTVIPGADFARIYFSIWLGDRPADEQLRAALLATTDS